MFTSDPFLFDLLEFYILKTFKISKDEWEFIQNNMNSEDELNHFTAIFKTNSVTFSEKKRALQIRNKYLSLYKN